jgi:hypothetical protein
VSGIAVIGAGYVGSPPLRFSRTWATTCAAPTSCPRGWRRFPAVRSPYLRRTERTGGRAPGEGSALRDCQQPDRIVIGSDDEGAAKRVARLFESVD